MSGSENGDDGEIVDSPRGHDARVGPPESAPGGGETLPGCWLLESFVDGRRTSRMPITALPFRVGRRTGLPLTLPSDLVSKDHAELVAEGPALRVRDLGSTNGTFVNRERVTEAALEEGDILHFAHFEFRLARARPDEFLGELDGEERSTKPVADLLLPSQLGVRARQLDELIRTGAAAVLFQRIVSLPAAEVEAYEALGRGRHSELPEEPVALLGLAAGIGMEQELSRLFRSKAFDALRGYPGVRHFFLNVHPSELLHPSLVDSLRELQAGAPPVKLTIEVHESAVVDTAGIRDLQARLGEIGVGLAYDDFGSGQARLHELSEVPPDYLKFDMRLVRGIDRAAESRRKVLQSLVALAHDLRVMTVAEGVETLSEAVACAELGFDFAQGFYFGRPKRLEEA